MSACALKLCFHIRVAFQVDAEVLAQLDIVKFPKWRSNSIHMRQKYGVAPSYAPWTTKKHIVCGGLPKQPRVVDLLDFAWSVRLQEADVTGEAQLRKGFFCDLSQSIARTPFGSLGCITTGLCAMACLCTYGM